MPVIDFHNHYYPPNYMKALQSGQSSVQGHDRQLTATRTSTTPATTTSPSAATAIIAYRAGRPRPARRHHAGGDADDAGHARRARRRPRSGWRRW